ncbi:hydroxyacid dehydrogenase [Sulfitobacter sp. D35]|uniref:hydroxyacid dehydrogenase n=1 Tax=Sulfitobacter sp. D35 TaxID=3083252 RepID=UPI00296F407B|nr:hydroxyacid dehydrogenase [Sulfitobacter sp. D35]MDW4500007.1 hydroxyacid dehydrogenase [Sulfitobacter sp. D35]
MPPTEDPAKPIVISAPEPRTLKLIFRPEALEQLHDRYDIRECPASDIARLDSDVLGAARYLIGQPALSEDTTDRMSALRCIFNVEGNFTGNLPYESLFRRGIHVVTPNSVFALPVAELGLALALDLLRGVSEADAAFRAGTETWGLESNRRARLLSGAEVGLIGFGNLGRTLFRLLEPFNVRARIHDPWLPPSVIAAAGADPASLETVLAQSDVVFVVAGITSENAGMIGQEAFASMREGSAFILLSRAEAVDFDALMDAVRSGRLSAASDVFPAEPMPADHPVRTLDGMIRSAHRAGALEQAFFLMGDYLLEDMSLLDRGLPPLRCSRAERETVSRLQSKMVSVN